ncbi:B12-binding domain-containing radical SAM protein [Pseudomonas sp. BIC9C]|uniref:B12-binding domain-containing radical SAM protein n=1 Tax=Pseudomonas sp. BIC9C TaxID=3078458 RepID=UPI002AD25318|nr:radical SAM protein [Pseudomonas sp. BIC9C]
MEGFHSYGLDHNGVLTTDVLIINPPIVDPTMPPHFAAYLVGAMKNSGLACSIRFDDLNVSILNHLTSAQGFDTVQRECDMLLENIKKKKELSKLDELQYKHISQIFGLTHEAIAEARSILTSTTKFYEFGQYQGAANLISRYIDATTATALPGMYSFWELDLSTYGDLSSADDLSDPTFLELLCKPFQHFLDPYLDSIAESNPCLIGISCNYISQLPYAINIARNLLSRNCSLNICIGGTEITDIYKNINKLSDLWRIFPPEIALVIGEGESAFTTLAKACLGGTKAIEGHIHHPNIVTSLCLSRKNSSYVEDINNIGTPDYSIYKMEDYWSPEPVILYSPTRGCYWNKCTFCDYGLNFNSPTSPSRERDLSGLRTDLKSIAKLAEAMYVAVDAISPKFLMKLCEEIKESKFRLSWSAEIRLEKKIVSHDLAKILSEGGCVGLSFGFESGSQRILDKINKGVDITLVPDLLDAVSNEGIHVQLMGFTGFPSETEDEASETFEFLERHKDSWTLSGIGSFVLTPGSIVAKSPSNFGVVETRSDHRDIIRSLHWMEEGGLNVDGSRHDSVRLKYSKMSTRVSLSRPYFGGIDTAHSILYFRRYPGASSIIKLLSTPKVNLIDEHIFESEFLDFMLFLEPSDVKRDFNSSGTGRYKLLKEWLSVTRPAKRSNRKFKITSSGRIFIVSNTPLPSWISAHFT